MYSWIWRHLPGGRPGKVIGSLVLVLAVGALLFFVVFPWLEPKLPFNGVTVDSGASAPIASASTTSAGLLVCSCGAAVGWAA